MAINNEGLTGNCQYNIHAPYEQMGMKSVYPEFAFLGMSVVFNFTNIGNKDNLAVHNIKWHLRTFFGLRM